MSLDDVPRGSNARPALALSGDPEATPAASRTLAGIGGAAGPLPALLDMLRHGQPPIPLLNGQANAQALRLHAAGCTYGEISKIMGTYHGVWLGYDGWRNRLRRAGAPPRMRQGKPIPPPHAYRKAAA